MDGMEEISEQIFDLPVRRGCPVGVGGLSDHVKNPAFATADGLVMYAQRNQMLEQENSEGIGVFNQVSARVRSLFKDFF